MSEQNPGTSAETPYTGPDYGLGEDNNLAHEVAQQDWRDAPRTHNLSRTAWAGSATAQSGASGLARATPETVSVKALSPEMAAPILQQLSGLTPEQRAVREPQLVLQAVAAKNDEMRILTGVGQFATPLAKAQVNIAYREREYERRIANWDKQLAEVTGWRAVFDKETGEPVNDPATGGPKMEPIYSMTGTARSGAEAERAELVRLHSVLQGPEGTKELNEALKETVKLMKEARQMKAEDDEARRRAAELNREERINDRAKAYAKAGKNTLG